MKKPLLLITAALLAGTARAQFAFAPAVAYPFNAPAFKALTTDLNGDQYPDIVVAGGAANCIVVLLNDQAGGLLPAQITATGAFCSGVAIVSLNCDAYADLLVTTANDNQVQAFYGSATGAFTAGATQAVPAVPSDVTVADFNRDGRPDFAAVSLLTGQVAVYLNSTAPAPNVCLNTFAAGVNYASESGPLSASLLRLADVNGDGQRDIVVVNSANPARKGLSVLFSTPTGSLSAPTLYDTDTGFLFDLTFTTLNADNTVDAVISDPDNNSVGVLLGSTTAPYLGGRASYPVGAAPLGLGSADFDKDGQRDVATVLRDGSVLLLPGVGDGTLKVPVKVATVPGGTWLLVADFNRDGQQDIAVVGSGSANLLLNRPTVLTARSAAAGPDLVLYPNPSTGTFHLPSGERGGELRVYDLAGRAVAWQRMGDRVTLPTAAPGLYRVELTTARECRRQTLMVQ